MSDNSDSTTPDFPLRPAKMPRFVGVRVVFALILREMSSSYGRSPGGYVWAVLEPAAGIALLTLVFSAAFTDPPIGISFPMFYSTGMVPFLMFMDLQGKVSQSLNFSRQLLAYPRVTFVDAILGRFILNTMTQIMVGYVIFTTCLVLFDTRTTLNFPLLLKAYFFTALLALGVGCMNCYLVLRFPIWQQVWSIITRPLFIVSGVFLLFETIPQPYQDWFWWNPLLHLVGMMRGGFYATYDNSYVSPTYLSLLSLTLMATALLLLRSRYRDLLQL